MQAGWGDVESYSDIAVVEFAPSENEDDVKFCHSGSANLHI